MLRKLEWWVRWYGDVSWRKAMTTKAEKAARRAEVDPDGARPLTALQRFILRRLGRS